MTPQEKAEDLVDRYYWVFGDGYLGDQHIQCALIAVDEIITELTQEISPSVHGFRHEYWKQVKQEIEKL